MAAHLTGLTRLTSPSSDGQKKSSGLLTSDIYIGAVRLSDVGTEGN